MQNKDNKPKPQAEMLEIDGAFGCSYCTNVSDTALYDPHRSLLIWQCQDGHKNRMEDVHLG